jgi:hypothetical protein
MEAYFVNIDSEKPLRWTSSFTAAEHREYWATLSDAPVNDHASLGV